MSRPSLRLLVGVVSGLALLGAGPAWAHPALPVDAGLHGAPAAAGASGLLVAAAALGVALALACGRAARRGLALALLVVLLALPFETGVHSVHHLGDRAGHAHCAVASVGAHLVGVAADEPIVDVTPLVLAGRVDVRPVTVRESSVLRPDTGRAPPAAVPA
jgi:hypothetical protein